VLCKDLNPLEKKRKRRRGEDYTYITFVEGKKSKRKRCTIW
jgi:hypothetical protein